MSAQATLGSLGEFGWIKMLQKDLVPSDRKVVGIGDDTAIIPGRTTDTLVTTDMIIEGRHFTRKGASSYEIGRKAMAVNLSDIAAMGGLPKYAVVAVGLPGGLKMSYLNGIMRGIRQTARDFNVSIIGGDTNQNEKIVICVTLIGEVRHGRAIRRSGAKKGDHIFVSGALGGSYATKKHLRFIPRVRLARDLSKIVSIHAMMDISDGLLSDLGHICEASHVRAVLFGAQIPLTSKNLSLKQALTDGEDFELLFTVSSSDARKILSSRVLRSQVYPVGRILGEGSDVRILDADGDEVRIKKSGFDHFKS